MIISAICGDRTSVSKIDRLWLKEGQKGGAKGKTSRLNGGINTAKGAGGGVGRKAPSDGLPKPLVTKFSYTYLKD